MIKLTRVMVLQLLAIAPILVLGLFSLVFGGFGMLGATQSRSVVSAAFVFIFVGVCVVCLVTAIVARPDAVQSRRILYGFVFAGLVCGCMLATILLSLGLIRDTLGTLALYGMPLVIGIFQCFRIGTSLSRANKRVQPTCEDARG